MLEVIIEVKVEVVVGVEVGVQLLFQVGGWSDKTKLILNLTQFEVVFVVRVDLDKNRRV